MISFHIPPLLLLCLSMRRYGLLLARNAVLDDIAGILTAQSLPSPPGFVLSIFL